MTGVTNSARRFWRWACLLLALGAVLGVQAAPHDAKLPGRKPGSMEPWGLFLGRTAHETIGRQYLLEHPDSVVFVDKFTLYEIIETGELGNPERLPKFVRLLRPDITDTHARVLFEVKPDNEEGLQQGREQSGRYLAALNAAVDLNKQLVRGAGFEGSLFLEFENGGALWRLAWRTPEPGVTLYRWSYRRKRSGASWKEHAAQKEEELPKEEIEKYGEMAEQAIRGAYEGSERPTGFQGQVYLPVDCR